MREASSMAHTGFTLVSALFVCHTEPQKIWQALWIGW